MVLEVEKGDDPLDFADNRVLRVGPGAWAKGPLLAAVVLLCTLFWGATATVRGQSNDELHQVEAAFIFHFAQLVDWPVETPQTADNSLYLCTLGEDPFQGALESTDAGKMIGTRIIRIRHLNKPEDMLGCRIIFLGKAQGERIPTLLAVLRNAPVLTVGETPGFLSAGGMICFHLEDNKVRFNINLDAARSAHMKIGSRLLLLARTVIGESRAE